MKRHNQTDKMNLRLKNKALKQEKIQHKNELERSRMESQANRKFTLVFVGLFRVGPDSDAFQVSLYKKMPIVEIKKRMKKAFEDI